MNQRAMVALGVLLGVASGTSPQRLLDRVHRELRSIQSKDPAASTVNLVFAAALLFYAAERGKNPKVESFYDALVYVATNLSVGYSDIFARTPLGKIVGSILMTYGPAMAARTLDPPSAEAEAPATDATLRALGGSLERILGELTRQRVQHRSVEQNEGAADLEPTNPDPLNS